MFVNIHYSIIYKPILPSIIARLLQQDDIDSIEVLEVKCRGVIGARAWKDDGVEGSFVSFRQVCHIYSTNHLLLTCSILLFAIRVSETSQIKRRTRSSAMV